MPGRSPLAERLYNLLGVQSVGEDVRQPEPDQRVAVVEVDLVVTGGVYEEIEAVVRRYGDPKLCYIIQHHRYEVVRAFAA